MAFHDADSKSQGLSKHQVENPVEEKDLVFEVWEAKEAFENGWLLGTMTPEMHDTFLRMSSVKQQ